MIVILKCAKKIIRKEQEKNMQDTNDVEIEIKIKISKEKYQSLKENLKKIS